MPKTLRQFAVLILFLQVISLSTAQPVVAQGNRPGLSKTKSVLPLIARGNADLKYVIALLFSANPNERTQAINAVNSRLDRVVSKFTKVIAKLKARTEKLKTAGKDTSSVDPLLANVDAKFNTFKNEKAALISLLRSINWNGDKTDNRRKVRDAAQKFADAGKALKDAINAVIKELRTIST